MIRGTNIDDYVSSVFSVYRALDDLNSYLPMADEPPVSVRTVYDAACAKRDALEEILQESGMSNDAIQLLRIACHSEYFGQ